MIWYLAGESSPVCSQESYPAFVRSPVLRRAAHVRVIGSAANADMVIDLWQRRVKGNLESVQLCSPAVTERRTVLDDPQTALYAMKAYGDVPSLGGWRNVESADLASFRLAAQTYFDRDLLIGHPVYKSMTFLVGLDESALFDLLASVIDPRWYVDPAAPDESLRLFDFLGINHRNYQRLQRYQAPTSEQERLAGRVRDVWICGRNSPTHLPGAFVLRAGYCVKGVAERELMSSMAFVEFLRAVWLNVLDSSHRGRLFVPELFFQEAGVAEAFRTHTGMVAPDRAAPGR
jgi:hypothetical protein